MNHKGIVQINATNFGRMLALHGRSSTIGAFPSLSQKFDATHCMKDLNDAQKKKHDESETTESGDEEETRKGTGDVIPASVIGSLRKVLPPEEKSMNPPLSKAEGMARRRNSDEALVTPSYSFYKRDFKVKGKDAWENAMRQLGSVDTLLNRYGYVEPKLRLVQEEPPGLQSLRVLNGSRPYKKY